MLKEKRISVLMDCKITKIKGTSKLEAIHFQKSGEKDTD